MHIEWRKILHWRIQQQPLRFQTGRKRRFSLSNDGSFAKQSNKCMRFCIIFLRKKVKIMTFFIVVFIFGRNDKILVHVKIVRSMREIFKFLTSISFFCILKYSWMFVPIARIKILKISFGVLWNSGILCLMNIGFCKMQFWLSGDNPVVLLNLETVEVIFVFFFKYTFYSPNSTFWTSN